MRAFLIALLAVARAETSPLLERSADYDYEPPVPGSYQLPRIKAATGGTVLDAAGKPLELGELVRGKVTVLSFIYSRCGDARACPYATGVLWEIHALSSGDEALGKQVRLISLSFDPVHDTPDKMAAYAKSADRTKPGADWHFLTTASPQALRPILAGYGQSVDENANPDAPTGPLNHTLRVYLIDAAGQVRNIYSSGTLDLRLVVADVRTLLLEQGHESAGNRTK